MTSWQHFKVHNFIQEKLRYKLHLRTKITSCQDTIVLKLSLEISNQETIIQRKKNIQLHAVMHLTKINA